MIKMIRNVFLTTFALLLFFCLITILLVENWTHTEAGKVPVKTAVLLHAINHNLVTPDMKPPKMFTSSGASTSYTRDMISIPVSDGSTIPARIYQPKAEGPHPIIMYYHGGAFLEGYGDINTHDNIVRSLAARTQSIVISVGYRVAPAHPFPTAIEDSYEALVWAVQNAHSINGDSEKIAVVGDSAGGNIATVVSLMARDRNGPELAAQAMLYPLTTFKDTPFQSRESYDSGYFLLSRNVMLRAREYYTPLKEMWDSPYTSPLDAKQLNRLPPALIITAEFDPLRDEGEAYGKRLADSGIPVEAVRYNGVMHGFVSFYEVMQRGDHALHHTAMYLKRAFHGEVSHSPYRLMVYGEPSTQEALQDRVEAYAIGGFLIGKQALSMFTGW
ncbi:alpha/beta hydrolase [Halalkalibacterium ligniniphilum]|uniref:alpha/beta hydrolase n=1 Tax=Halalkalibacterium ligniniphilum TaxID=1134413 RepID=UPI00037BA085